MPKVMTLKAYTKAGDEVRRRIMMVVRAAIADKAVLAALKVVASRYGIGEESIRRGLTHSQLWECGITLEPRMSSGVLVRTIGVNNSTSFIIPKEIFEGSHKRQVARLQAYWIKKAEEQQLEEARRAFHNFRVYQKRFTNPKGIDKKVALDLNEKKA